MISPQRHRDYWRGVWVWGEELAELLWRKAPGGGRVAARRSCLGHRVPRIDGDSVDKAM
jgi:hypothetical protein